jgi:hypothetical protein
MATPQITLTANLETILAGPSGIPIAGFLRVTLCGFGPQIPAIPGTCVLADAGVPQIVGPQEGSTAIALRLWGNDQIEPVNTFYEVAVLDENENVIQSGMYVFTGTTAYDLSSAAQILPPFNLGFLLYQMKYLPCAGSLVGGNRIFTAPGLVIAPTYNGVLLSSDQYSLAGNVITLNFDPELGDRIDALCIAAA